jgi:hypothetical protein
MGEGATQENNLLTALLLLTYGVAGYRVVDKEHA